MSKSLEELATEYAINARYSGEVDTVAKFAHQNELYAAMVRRVGVKATDAAITQAHQILKMSGH